MALRMTMPQDSIALIYTRINVSRIRRRRGVRSCYETFTICTGAPVIAQRPCSREIC